MKPKQQTDKLWCVEVPKDATDFSYDSHRNYISATIEANEPEFNKDWFSEILPVSKIKLIGTGELINGVPTWDFDVSVYIKENDKNGLLTNEGAFLSLHEANGIYFVNPLQKLKDGYMFKGSENMMTMHEYQEWEKMESKTIKGKLIYFETI